MVTPDIRLLKEADYDSLFALFDATGDKHMRGWRFDPDASLVALHEGQVVGFVSAWHGGQPYAWVDCLLVHPDHQRRGIGAWLCLVLERLLVERGVKAIRAAAENVVVIEGLRKHGFRGQPQMVMEKFYGGDYERPEA